MHPQTHDFMALFSGFEDAYGVYQLTVQQLSSTKPGKRVGKAHTKNGKVTVELFDKHLCGNQGLGITPINKDSQARFGAIDVDEYPLDLVALQKKINECKFPLIVCRTKSGGAHLYVFTTEPVDAAIVQTKLREMASHLGYGSCEIYPRQSKLLAERGDRGQWINLPYFDGDRTERYSLDDQGRRIPVTSFVKFCYEKRITQEQLEALDIPVPEKLPGGPPCLQRLVTQGFPNGTRNNGLFNLGVYAMKSDPENWAAKLEEYNNKYMDPPLTAIETLGVVKSLKKKEYNYTCHAQPVQSYCNKDVCKMCKFGVGMGDAGMPKFGTLTKLLTEPPIWFLDIEGGDRLELNTEDLQQPARFQKRCMDALNIMPSILKRDAWQGIVAKLLENVTEVEVPEEATPKGLLLQHLEDFCTSRVQAKTYEEILLGKPWSNDNKHYFRLRDFMSYLDRVRFDLFEMNYIAFYIREIGGEKKFWNIRGKGCNCFSIPEFKNKQTEPFKTPEQVEPKF